ncbi:hypothetical protein METESE_26240 [Mesoterricola sediminis]|uniref:Uncharacterized protein n=2 Tax=Mesoterricola sediminis TaxID=2927980 RepID=A0AA48GR06_9BACT|nr:hypothetical protein METESE_26240 [Mesoterricola sediminis]
MRYLNRSLQAALAACLTLPGLAQAEPDKLDALYGFLSQPAYIKHYEATRNGKVLINPYLQVATKEYPAILDAKNAPYNWVIDAEGRVAIIQEAAHPLGRTYAKGFFRPEDKSKRKPGTTENYGHVSALAGAPGRISGEILYDKATNTFTINNKSGRYTKHNTDRTPEQLANAAKLIMATVEPGKATWGPVYYLLEYAPEPVQEELMKSPKLAYDDPVKKSRPHIIVTPASDAPQEVAKPKAKAKKQKAAHNDDPS